MSRTMSQASPVPGFREPGSNEHALKEEVRDFWNADPCGSRYLGDLADFEAHARARYQLEPYIHEFAGFARSGGQRVLYVGGALGATFLEWLTPRPTPPHLDL